MPGCVKEMRPASITLNSGLRNHLVKRDTGFLLVSSTWGVAASGEMTEEDIFECFQAECHGQGDEMLRCVHGCVHLIYQMDYMGNNVGGFMTSRTNG